MRYQLRPCRPRQYLVGGRQMFRHLLTTSMEKQRVINVVRIGIPSLIGWCDLCSIWELQTAAAVRSEQKASPALMVHCWSHDQIQAKWRIK